MSSPWAPLRPIPLPPPDLDLVMEHAANALLSLHHSRLFVTGGTGFFGHWLLEALLKAQTFFDLDLDVFVLTRDPAEFARRAPWLAREPLFTFWQGDVRNFPFPSVSFTHIIHGATQASAALNAGDPLQMFDVCVEGTRHVLDLAAQRGAERFLLISSGAIYGEQPPALKLLSEEYPGAPSLADVGSAYAQGKRIAEWLGQVYGNQTALEIITSRAFAFIGPHLPIDMHFAAGNFLQDALNARTIIVNGDGTALRSYLYAADLVVWLLKLLSDGQAGQAYNVGSPHAVSISELASVVAKVAGGLEVNVLGSPVPGQLPHRYVPDVSRATNELGLHITVPLEEAVRRHFLWLKACRGE